MNTTDLALFLDFVERHPVLFLFALAVVCGTFVACCQALRGGDK